MKKKIVFIIIALTVTLTFTTVVFAQSSSSVRTIVGSPPVPTGGSGLLGVGTIFKNAYDACAGGDTHEPPASASCLERELRNQGFSEDQIAMYRQNRGRLVESPSGKNALCLQCLGFLQTVFSVYANAPMQSYSNPKAMVGLQVLTAGNKTFKKLPKGTPPQPGDVGVHGSGTAGHIVIVQELIGNTKIRALESNGLSDCRVTNNRDILMDQYGYIFFREE